MQKKTEPSQILFAALALQRSQLILHPYPSLLIPSFLQYQHLQAERDPDHWSPPGTQFPMDSASPPCSYRPRLWALSKTQAYQLASPESLRVGVLGKVSSLASVDRWLPGWNSNLCFWSHPYVKVAQNEEKWGGREGVREGGRNRGGKGWGYVTGRKNNINLFFLRCI